MKKILVYLKDYKKESILAPLFKMLEASFELLVPLVVKKIVDIGIVNSDRSDWSGLLHYGAVLFSQGRGGVCYKIKTCAVRTHAEAVLRADRPHGYVHHDYPYDQ